MELSLFEKVNSGKALNRNEIKKIVKTLKKIHSRGGVVVVSENDTLITTYGFNSYDRKRAYLNKHT